MTDEAKKRHHINTEEEMLEVVQSSIESMDIWLNMHREECNDLLKRINDVCKGENALTVLNAMMSFIVLVSNENAIITDPKNVEHIKAGNIDKAACSRGSPSLNMEVLMNILVIMFNNVIEQKERERKYAH